jgi:hypothetical protein
LVVHLAGRLEEDLLVEALEEGPLVAVLQLQVAFVAQGMVCMVIPQV